MLWHLDGASTLGTLSVHFPKGVPTGANSYTIAAMIKTDTVVSGSGGWIGWGNNSFDNAKNAAPFRRMELPIIGTRMTWSPARPRIWRMAIGIPWSQPMMEPTKSSTSMASTAERDQFHGSRCRRSEFHRRQNNVRREFQRVGRRLAGRQSGARPNGNQYADQFRRFDLHRRHSSGGDAAANCHAASVDLNGVNQHVASLADGTGGGGGITNGGQADSTLTLNGSGVTAFSGVISDGSSNKISLVLSGGGTQTLSGAIHIPAGQRSTAARCELPTPRACAMGSGGVTLNNGTLSSGTVGAISGTVAAGSPVFTRSPRVASGAMGTLTLGGLTTSSSTTLNFDLCAPVSSGSYSGDLIVIGANGLTVNNGTMVSFGTNAPAVGDYRLFGGNFGMPLASNFSLPPAPMGTIYSLSYMVDSGYYDLSCRRPTCPDNGT